VVGFCEHGNEPSGSIKKEAIVYKKPPLNLILVWSKWDNHTTGTVILKIFWI
jgi:hypothetical protein